jgi:hypothetical protein
LKGVVIRARDALQQEKSKMSNTAMADVYVVSETSGESLAGAETSDSAVSWGAIVAGAFAAAGTSLILISLGAGLGFSAASPWGPAASAQVIGASAIVWLVVTQWLSAGIGGYIAGRLRTKWVGVHTHEVFFRDTAHGFLAWAVGAVISAVLLSSAVSSLVGEGARLGSSAIAGAAQVAGQAAGNTDVTGYFVDGLFRSDRPAPADDQALRGEVTRIMTVGLANGDVSAPDRTYLAQLVASRTGLSQPDAEKRVSDVINQAKSAAAEAADKARQVADDARRAAAAFGFAMCLSLLVGAFIASVAGVLGGDLRDGPQSRPVR